MMRRALSPARMACGLSVNKPVRGPGKSRKNRVPRAMIPGNMASTVR